MTNTNAVDDIMIEAMEHVGRHGFEPAEVEGSYSFIGSGGWEALFQVISWQSARVVVEVYRFSASRSLLELKLADYMGGVHPDAVFLDRLEDALVDAKRRVTAGDS